MYWWIIVNTVCSGIIAWLFLNQNFSDYFFYSKRNEYLDENDSENKFVRWKPSKQIHIVLSIVIGMMAAGSYYQLFRVVSDPINICKMILVVNGVIVAGCVDLRERIIPNRITGCMAIGGILLLVLGAVSKQNGAMAYIYSSVFATIVSVSVLCILSFITRQGMGFGDIKLIGAIGIIGGVTIVIGTLFIATILSAIVACILLGFRRMEPKSVIPFGPFIMTGCMLTVMLLQF